MKQVGLNLQSGLNALLSTATSAEETQLTALTGITMRIGYPWGQVEKTKGHYTWTSMDQHINILLLRGYSPVFVLSLNNPLYGGVPLTDVARAACANWCAAAAARYRGKPIYWELHNEPDESKFWMPQPANQTYALAAMACAQAMKHSDPNCLIAFGAMSSANIALLNSCLSVGVQNFCTGLSLHLYHDYGQPETMERGIMDVRHLLTQPGLPNLDILVTESGYSVGTMNPYVAPNPVNKTLILSPPTGQTQQSWSRYSIKDILAGIPDPVGTNTAFRIEPSSDSSSFSAIGTVPADSWITVSAWLRSDIPGIYSLGIGTGIANEKIWVDQTWREFSCTVQYLAGISRVFRITQELSPDSTYHPFDLYQPKAELVDIPDLFASKENRLPDLLQRTFDTAKALNLKTLCWYEWPTANSSYNPIREDGFGIRRADGSLRPHHNTLKQLANQ